jgi:ABC-2 type transport system permease protein
MSSAAAYLSLSRRSMMNVVRQPIAIVPSMMFPLLFLALSSAALARSTSLPGFPPVDSFLQFLITTTIIQATMFGSIGAGANMASDIEGGFFERLIATPVSRTSILVGRVAGAVSLAFAQALVIFLIGLLFGFRPVGGVVGMFLVALVAAIFAGAIGSIAVAFGLRTGSTEAVQGSFPLLFALLFLSSAFFPRSLMTGWFRTVADYNPISHLIEGLRAQLIYGIRFDDFLISAAIALGIFVFGVLAAHRALQGRLLERP